MIQHKLIHARVPIVGRPAGTVRQALRTNETNNTQEKAPHEASPSLHISLLAAASLLTFALGAPCQAATEAPSADKATSYSEEDKDLLDTAQGLFQPLPDAAAMQKLRPFTDA